MPCAESADERAGQSSQPKSRKTATSAAEAWPHLGERHSTVRGPSSSKDTTAGGTRPRKTEKNQPGPTGILGLGFKRLHTEVTECTVRYDSRGAPLLPVCPFRSRRFHEHAGGKKGNGGWGAKEKATEHFEPEATKRKAARSVERQTRRPPRERSTGPDGIPTREQDRAH